MSADIKKVGGRPNRTGLDYYPLYSSLFNSKKMQQAEDLVDPSGMDMLKRLLVDKMVTRFYSSIFTKGYYLLWNEEEEKNMCSKIGNGMNPIWLKPYLDAMLTVGFLNADLYKKYGILTSRGIQQKWLKISKLIRRSKPTIEEIYFINSPKNEFHRDGKVVSSRRNNNKFTNKPESAALPTEINTSNNDNQRFTTEAIPVVSRSNTDTLPNQGGVSYSTTINKSNTDNVLLDNTIVVVVGNLPEETIESSRRKANNSQFGTEQTNIDDNNTTKEGVFIREETNVYSVTNYQIEIPGNSQDSYPIEQCLWNYLNNKAYKRASEQHMINWGVMWTTDELRRWGEAFNRSNVSDGITERPFNGNSGWLRHIKNWVPTTGNYKEINPDVLYTVNDLKNGDKQSQPGQLPAANSRGKQSKQSKVGGVQADSVANLLTAKREQRSGGTTTPGETGS